MVRWSFIEGYTIWTFSGERDSTWNKPGPWHWRQQLLYYDGQLLSCVEAVGEKIYINLGGVFVYIDGDADGGFGAPENVEFFEAMQHHLNERDNVL